MILKTTFAAAAFVALASVTSFAQTAPAADPTAREANMSKFREACGADVQKFCATVDKARGAIRTCLDSHAADLSATCKTARAERAAAKQ